LLLGCRLLLFVVFLLLFLWGKLSELNTDRFSIRVRSWLYLDHLRLTRNHWKDIVKLIKNLIELKNELSLFFSFLLKEFPELSLLLFKL